MKGFFETAMVVFRSRSVYRVNTLLAMAGKLVKLAVPLFVWQALYSASGSETVNGRTLRDMVVYVLISGICTSLMSADFAETIESRMKTGLIEYNFLRPLPTRLIFAGESLGQSLYELAVSAAPVLLLSLVLFPVLGLSVPLVNIPFFILSLFFGYMISLLFELLKGMFAFWFVNVFILNWFLDLFYVLLSGAYVPLWFFPEWLRAVASFLPFQAACFLPVEIFLGARDAEGCVAALLIQLAWIAVLWLLQEIMWRKSVRKLTIMGG